MSTFVTPLAVFLAAVFAASAIGKLRAPDHGRAAFAALQLRLRHPGAASIALIVSEAVVAGGLLATWGWAFLVFAGAAVVLTGGLLVVVIRAHRMGATDDCGCFGDWLPAPIGPRLITRNIVLTLVAVATLGSAVMLLVMGEPLGLPLVLTSPLTAGPAVGALTASVLIAAATWAVIRAMMRPEDAESAAVPGAGSVLLPETSEIVDLLSAGPRARLVVFVSAGCHACETALAGVRSAQSDLGALVDVYVVQKAASGTAGARSAHDLPASARFAVDVGGSLAARLGTGPATPVAALIGTDGSPAGPLAIGSDEVAELVAGILSVARTTRA